MPDEELAHGLVVDKDVVQDGQVDVGGLVDEGVPLSPGMRFLNREVYYKAATALTLSW